MKYFIIGVVVAFVLYWATTGFLRRLFAPPQRRRRTRGGDTTDEVPPAKERTAIDYSRVRDADFRDL